MTSNPFSKLLKQISVDGKEYQYYSLKGLNDSRIETLPYSIRVLLEGCLRKCDEFSVKSSDVEKILNWGENCKKGIEIPFNPARVLMQDFTGVPAVVDLAALRDAAKRLGADPKCINPLVPVDLVIDHSVQVDAFRTAEALAINEKKEFERNYERFKFLKWGSKAFDNLQIVPPGSGIVHQVNLEYLARVVFMGENEKSTSNLLYPDTLVGTDSHTTMINGLGVLGWGVGGIEAEAAMLGQSIAMVLPKVVGYKLVGKLQGQATSTDLVLTITQNLRKLGVVEKFVEFYGEGVSQLSLADRATISNMCPEYGATAAYFPVDDRTLKFLHQSGRDEHRIHVIEKYLKEEGLFATEKPSTVQYTENLTLDLSTVVPSLAGPKRPQDRVAVSDMKKDFTACLTAKRGFKGFEAPLEEKVTFEYSDGKSYELNQGSVVIAAITSCTNTSNPSVMLAAGLVAKKAIEKGLTIKPYIKTSLSPGSGVVSRYLSESGLQDHLNQLGFNVVGYGCMTCIGNSGDLPDQVTKVLTDYNNLVAASVLSGNRNFEARVHPLTKANYLASPPLVVAYALAGTVNIDFETEPLGNGVYLKDIWPSHEEIQSCVDKFVQPEMFKQVYNKIKNGTENWNNLQVPETELYPWDEKSTYIHNPPYFQQTQKTLDKVIPVKNAYVLLNLGDSITTDHISPAGNIAVKSPAAQYLIERGVERKDFNSYGSRRGNDQIMVRGTFANTALLNKLVGKPGPQTIYVPSGNNEPISIFDAAEKYKQNKQQVIVLGGQEYGSGSSRDWAAKGPYLLGVRAVISVSFERIHRSNLVGMGIIPLQFKAGQSTESLGLTGREQFTIDVDENVKPGQDVIVHVTGNDKISQFTVTCRFDTAVEIEYFKNGGVLHYVLRNIITKH